MADPSSLEIDAEDFLKKAKDYEQNKNYDLAVFYYVEAVQAWINAKNAGSSNPDIMNNARNYTRHAEKLVEKRGKSTIAYFLPKMRQMQFRKSLLAM